MICSKRFSIWLLVLLAKPPTRFELRGLRRKCYENGENPEMGMKAKPAKMQPDRGEDFRTNLEFQQRLIEGSRDCIKVLDLEGRLVSMNAGGVEILEICDLPSVLGSYWVDFWEGVDREAAKRAVETARTGGVGRFVGIFTTLRTRQQKHWDVVVSAIKDKDGKPEKLLAVSRDITEWKRAEELLRAITDGTAAVTGQAFFCSLVKHLSKALNVRFAFVAECLPKNRARSLAFWIDNNFGANFEYDLPGTPCMEVSKGRTCHFPDRVPELFPSDKGMIDLGTVSYLGVPLFDKNRRVIGHAVVFDDKPMPADLLSLSVMETFAARAAVELERERAFEDLERRKQESDERFRDLFEEAPIAYVHEGLDSKFIRANRAALRSFGIKPEEVEGTYGKDFVPDTPDAQRRLREAFESIGRGTDTSGVVLELRRKDNGNPLWIQWWSKPDVGGKFTRTMFVDITERVLMEQEKARLEAQNTYLQEEIRSEHNFGEIVGSSPALLDVLRQVEQVARIDSTVLIFGETGTGKELIARGIHDRSPRKNRALVKVNCGAISAGLVESELFGHIKGAFTGAIANRDGRFKLADGGTIFLDEVGELPMDTQVKLLRVLQEQEFEPIGSSKTIKVNVRVVAATNRDLEELVREGKFRADLFYRLNVVPLRVPALRERVSDMPLLVTFFLQKCAKKIGKHISSVSEEAMRGLTNYSWPGNIRELQNVIERAVILSPGRTLVLAEELRAKPAQAVHAAVTKSKAIEIAPAPDNNGSLDDVERRHITSVLHQANWMIEGERGAARILEMNPSTLRSRMQKLGIKRPIKAG